MNYSKIAVRYAKAVFLLAEEKKQLKEVANDMETLLKVEREVPEISDLYNNPILSISDKKKAITAVFEKSFNEISMNFLNLIFDNKRETHTSGVARNFLKRYREHLGIKNASLTTATKIADAKRDEIIEIIKKTYNTEVELELNENPDIIGGFVLKVEDTQFDASISTQLKNIKQELLS